MCWGDVKLHKTASGVEYLEFNERQTRIRPGSDYSDDSAVPPKLFATDGTERDPFAVYKFFARKRPEEMNQDDAPFYLAVNNTLKADSLARKSWFKSGAIGVNELNGLLKTIVQKAGTENDRLRNHSGRKTMIQTLSEHNIPSTQIAQLSGYKNLKSIEKYSTVSVWRLVPQLRPRPNQPVRRPPTPKIPVSSPRHCSVELLFKVVIFPFTSAQ